LKELVNCYLVETVEFERSDGFWLDDGKLLLRSHNVGEIVEARYQSPFCEARYSLDKDATNRLMILLDADRDSLAYRLKQHFGSAAALDQFKRFCDYNELPYTFDFIVNTK